MVQGHWKLACCAAESSSGFSVELGLWVYGFRVLAFRGLGVWALRGLRCFAVVRTSVLLPSLSPFLHPATLLASSAVARRGGPGSNNSSHLPRKNSLVSVCGRIYVSRASAGLEGFSGEFCFSSCRVEEFVCIMVLLPLNRSLIGAVGESLGAQTETGRP